VTSFTVNYTTPASAGRNSSSDSSSPPSQSTAQTKLVNVNSPTARSLEPRIHRVQHYAAHSGLRASKTEQGTHYVNKHTTRKPRPSTVQVWKLLPMQIQASNLPKPTEPSTTSRIIRRRNTISRNNDSGWGTLLLGIGGVLAGVGATVYAFKRPRGLSSAVSNPSASTSALMPSK